MRCRHISNNARSGRRFAEGLRRVLSRKLAEGTLLNCFSSGWSFAKHVYSRPSTRIPSPKLPSSISGSNLPAEGPRKNLYLGPSGARISAVRRKSNDFRCFVQKEFFAQQLLVSQDCREAFPAQAQSGETCSVAILVTSLLRDVQGREVYSCVVESLYP